MSLIRSDSSAREEYQLPSKVEDGESEESEKEGEPEVAEEEEFKMVVIAKDGESMVKEKDENGRYL